MAFEFVCVKPSKKLYIFKDKKKIKEYNCAIGGGKDIGGNGASEDGYQIGGIWNDYLTPMGSFKLIKWVTSKDDMIVTFDKVKYNLWKRKIHLNCRAKDPNTNKMRDKGIRIHSSVPDFKSGDLTHGCIKVSQNDLIDIWNTITDKSKDITIHILKELALPSQTADNITTGMEESKLDFVYSKSLKNT